MDDAYYGRACLAGCTCWRCQMEQRLRGIGVGIPVQGCICPPGAEKTCQGGMCPRRPWKAEATA